MITGLLFVFTVYRFGLNFEALQYLIIIGILIPVFLIDLEHSIIPDGLNIGILVVSVISVLIQIYTGDKVWSDLLNTSSIDINWNGVEIAELLIYNSNIDSTEVTSYLTKKYKF